MTKSNANQQEKNIITDRPILDTKEDAFFSESRLVDPILEVISGNKITPCTIALMGEWGSGKTSALNLLRNKLKSDKKNIVVDFDPLIEGKFEIRELLACFYLKLLPSLKEKKLKSAAKNTKKALKSLACLLDFKTSVCLPAVGRIEGNLGKNIENTIKIWEEEKPQLYSEQILELNNSLKKNPLYVIIDEIDRLPSKQILSFLMFSRVLESFDNLVCIIAFDYTQVIEKFISENTLGNTNYSAVNAYIDKLFQIRFDVCNILFIDAITEYAKKKINIIFKENDELINLTNEADAAQVFHNILVYLETPRRINKWLMNLLKNKNIIKNAIKENKLLWLKFIATYVKHPIILDVFLRKEVNIYLCTDSNAHSERIAKCMELNITYAEDLLNNLTKTIDNDDIDRLGSEDLSVRLHIDNTNTRKYLADFLLPEQRYNAQKALIYAFAEGIQNEDELKMINNFFEQNSNDVLLSLVNKNDRKTALLALNIANALEKTDLKIMKPLEIPILNKLWLQKCNPVDESSSAEFTRLITNLFSRVRGDTLIISGHISLSARYVANLLKHYGIRFKNGTYNLNDFRKNETQKQFFYKDKKIQSQAELREILKMWLSEFEKSLFGDKWQPFLNFGLLLEHHIALSNTVGTKKPQEHLAKIIKSYLESGSSHKEEFIDHLKKEQKNFDRFHNHKFIESLFNNDPDICSCLGIDKISLSQELAE